MLNSLMAVTDVSGPITPPNIPDVLVTVLGVVNTLLFGIAPVLLVVMLVSAGVKRLMAADNPKAVQDSNSTIMWAIVGYAVVLLSYLIVRLGASLLGYDIDGKPGLSL